jgi:alkylation response protein AidB-like acyl-CoA dehydrogenase
VVEVDLLPSADQLDMVETVGEFLAGNPAGERLWAGAAELGVFSLGLPEEAGGAGCPVVEEALVFRSLGRHLAPTGLLASLLAARIAHAMGDKELRDELASGARRAALALPGVDVIDLPGASHLVTWEAALVPVEGLAAGEPLDSLDPSSTLTRIGALPAAEPVAEVASLGALLTAAMLVGISEAARDSGVEYAKQRVQFGRPIGTNQAIKHPCADMAVDSEAAASLLFFAALALREGREDAEFQVAAAKRIATTAALANARTTMQIHGGMGFTWEQGAHLLLTRAHLLDQAFGDVRRQQRTLLRTAPSVP